jgi:hypothetical protein
VSMADHRGVLGKIAEPTAKEGNNDALAQQIIRMIGERPACGWRRCCGRVLLRPFCP